MEGDWEQIQCGSWSESLSLVPGLQLIEVRYTGSSYCVTAPRRSVANFLKELSSESWKVKPKHQSPWKKHASELPEKSLLGVGVWSIGILHIHICLELGIFYKILFSKDDFMHKFLRLRNSNCSHHKWPIYYLSFYHVPIFITTVIIKLVYWSAFLLLG